MPFSWTLVGNTGYDVEEIDDPRSHEMICPACGKQARFVEKQLIKNLRVLGVPLVGIEKGKRVYECPRCAACVEAPDEPESARVEQPTAVSAATDALAARRERVRDEVWLWQGRADAAHKHGDPALAAEALAFKVRAQGELERIDALIAAKGGAVSTVSKPRASTESRGAARANADSSDYDFAALKARLAGRGAASEGEREDADAREPEVSDAEVAALRARLAARGAGAEGSPRDAYEALRREVRDGSERAATGDGVVQRDVPPAPPPERDARGTSGDDDEDPAAALKRKLRGGKGGAGRS